MNKIAYYLIAILLAIGLFGSTIFAQSDSQYAMSFFSFISGGRSETANSRFTVEQSIGPPVAGSSSNGSFDLASGMLSGSPIPNLVLIYVGADNKPDSGPFDLGRYIPKLVRKAHVGANETDGVVLLLLDGPQDNDARIYLLGGDSPEEDCFNVFTDYTCKGHYVEGKNVWTALDEYEDTGAPGTLTSFIVDSVQKYPAENIILSLVGHGGGWSPNTLAGQPNHIGGQPDELGGLLWDYHSGPGQTEGHALSTIDLGTALADVLDKTGRRINLLYLDACLMGMWEVAHQLAPTVDYLLASESWSWTSFEYHKHLAAVKQGKSIEDIGTAWIENEKAFLDGYRPPYTYSLLDLTQLDPLSESIHSLATTLKDSLPNSKAIMAEVFTQTDRFDSTQDKSFVIDGKDNYADIGHLATQIEESFDENSGVVNAARIMRTELEKVVVRSISRNGFLPEEYLGNEWSWQAPSGLSIYFPFNPEQDDWKRRHYHQLTSSKRADGSTSSWADLIETFWGVEAPDEPDCPDPCGLPLSALTVETIDVYLPLITR